ncbi:hypothetical protein [Microbacterium rhizophilus]|uniref:hypothetical protein n=1 Tax=Microbacterium rhizophilus TaxID=3138934 RepID=UPI0031EA2723
MTVVDTSPPRFWSRTRSWAVRALRLELGVYTSIGRAIARRPALPRLGIWGLTWMVGLLCAMLMRPHAVGPEGIRARSGLEIDVPLSWDDIASVEIAKSVAEEKAPRIVDEDGRATLALRMANETNILILLERPTPVRLPGLAPKGGGHLVERVRLWADDPKALMREVATHI